MWGFYGDFSHDLPDLILPTVKRFDAFDFTCYAFYGFVKTNAESDTIDFLTSIDVITKKQGIFFAFEDCD